MRTVWQVTLPVLVVAASFAEGSTGTDVSSTGVSCDLQCANGGYCTLVEGTFEELAHDAQSGHLIEQCVCRPGFTGVACDTVVEECSLPERTCHNGAPCTQNSSGEWGCDCSIADSLSLFAGYQCRNPTTEYCSGKYDPNAALSFCTHGGRCIGDFLAAEVAPGDTAFNKAYQHRGCRCPTEFYGPHCEFLKFGDTEEIMEEPFPPESTMVTAENSSRSPFLILVTTLMCLSFIMMVALVRYKLTEKRVPHEITVDHSSFAWGNLYSDSQLNGRHHRSLYQSQNLHVQSVFDDATNMA